MNLSISAHDAPLKGQKRDVLGSLTSRVPEANKRTRSQAEKATMSVKRYFNGFSPAAVRDRILREASVSFSPGFVSSCRFWFAANSIWATLIVAASVMVALRFRLDKSWAFISLLVVLSAALILPELRKTRPSFKMLLILILGVASTGFLLWPCLEGAFVSVTGDTFLYTAFGQYLANHHRGLEFGLSPIDQYSTGLSETRFCTAAVLGFLSVLFRSTTAAVLPFYIFIILANIFSGFVLLSRRFGCNRLFSLAAGLFAVIAGWTPNALKIGGLDNLLFLSLFPFLVVRLECYRFGSKSWSTSLGLAILAASAFYVYPEGLAIAGAIFLLFFCQSVWSGMYRRGRAWRRYVISACLVLVLIFPYVRVFVDSLREHVATGMSKGAVGIFPGLLSPRFLPAIFGFGQEYPGTIYSPHDLVLPILMLAFIVLGCATWIRRRKSLILAFLILIMMAIWQGALLQYDYGLYKILFIGSLIWIPSLFRGGTAVSCFVPRTTRPFAVTLGTAIFFSGALAQRMEQQDKIPWREIKPVKWYSDLANLGHRVGNRPVLLVCNNPFDQDWAVYFLRHVNLKVPEYLGYLSAFPGLMQRAKTISDPAAYVLVNERMEGAAWKNELYSLLELGSQAKIIGVQGANGLEDVNGKPLVWLGNDASRFLIVSNFAQTANFSAWECLTGPNRLEDKDRKIRISIGGKVWQADISGALSVEVPLKPGLNFLDLAYQDSPTVAAQSTGDADALPLGLWDYRISSK
jgi:hypothetical protein